MTERDDSAQVPLLDEATTTTAADAAVVTPGQITGPQLFPALTRPMLGLTKRRRDELFAPTLIHLFLVLLRVALFVSFALLVLVPLDLPYAYRRPEQKPGPLTDDRLSLSYFLVAVSALWLLGLATQAIMIAAVMDRWRRAIHFYVDSTNFLLSLVQFGLLLGVLWLGCNRSYSGGSICNDARWCDAYAPGGSSRCPVYAGPPVATSSLRPAQGFAAFCWLAGIQLVLTGASVVFNPLMRDAVRAFRHRTGDAMMVEY